MKYSQYGSAKMCAAKIVSDCIISGESSGWSGSMEDFMEVEKICNQFGVVYVDDMNGTWKAKSIN